MNKIVKINHASSLSFSVYVTQPLLSFSLSNHWTQTKGNLLMSILCDTDTGVEAGYTKLTMPGHNR